MKKTLALVLAVLLAVACCASALAESVDFSGYSFQELLALREQLDAAMVNSIPATVPEGNIYNDFVFVSNGSEVMIKNYQGNASDIFFPDEINGLPVTMIGADVLYQYDGIQTIRLPKNLKSIGKNALCLLYGGDHEKLVIVLPKTLESIDMNVLSNAHAKCVVIQSNIQLGNCRNTVKQLYIKEGCSVKFPNYSSNFDSYLKMLVLPASQTNIPDGIFENCGDLIVVCPAGSYAEDYCKRNFLVCNTDAYEQYVQEFENLIP